MMQFTNDVKIGEAPYYVPRTYDEMQQAIETHYIIPSFRHGKLTVDKMLDHADVVLEWYIPSEYSIDFMNFMRLVLGEEPENSNPKAHYFMIDCIFKEECVRPYFDVRGIDYDMLKDRVLVLCTREFSKALTLDTKLATPSGYVKMKNIKKNDIVIDRNGKPTLVTSKSGLFFNNTYKITLSDGRIIETSYNHDNIIWKRKNKRISRKYTKGIGDQNIRGLEEKVMTTEEIYRSGFMFNKTITNNQKKGSEYKYFIPRMNNPIEFNSCNFPIDPYTVGVILGDGSIDKNTGFTRITCHKDDFEIYEKNIPYKIGTKYEKKDSNAYFFSLLGIGKLVKEHIGTEIVYYKRIPKPLLTGSVDERIAVLQGLMDTDGSINKKGSASFSSTSKGLVEDVLEIVRSLGGTGTISKRKTNSTFGVSYWIGIKINNIKLFKHPRKLERQTYIPARDMVGIENIELIHSVPTQCITVESDTKSFILENGIVTHNSTLLGSMLVLYMAAHGELPGFGKVNYMLYVSDSMRNNVKTTMDTIKQVYYESAYLQSIFESVRLVQDEVNFVRNPVTKKEIAVYKQYVEIEGKPKDQVPGRMKRTFSMSGLGASTGGRGSRDGLARPNGVFFDDLLGSEVDAESDTILENVESTIESDILPALSGNGSFKIFAGTPYNKKDPAYSRIEDGSWLPVVFPKAEKMDDTITEDNFRGVWPDRHSYATCKGDYLKAKRAADNGKETALRKLNQEYYLRISSDEDRLVPDRLIQWYSRQRIVENAWAYNWYVTTDYTSTGKKGSDISGGALWAVDSNSNHFLVDLILRKMELETQYRETFNFVKQCSGITRGIEVGVETDGQQGIHIYALKERMAKEAVFFTIARQKGQKLGSEGIRSKLEGGNKHWRFRMMLPYFQNKKIWFPDELKGSEDMNELLNEIKYTTYTGFGATHDDGNDILSQLIMMDINYPPPGLEAENKPRVIKNPMNAKIWGKKNEVEDESNIHDSYA